jgi:hypothetical protein
MGMDVAMQPFFERGADIVSHTTDMLRSSQGRRVTGSDFSGSVAC